MSRRGPVEKTNEELPVWRFAIGQSGHVGPTTSAPILELRIGDITEDDSGAIVNPTNSRLEGGGMVDLAIRRAAGPRLASACRAAYEQRGGDFPRGETLMTLGFDLRAGYVVHCVLPGYAEDPDAALALLESCCQRAIQLARAQGLGSIAFPAIATGVLGYPLDKAALVAMKSVIGEVVREPTPFRVRFILFGPAMLEAYVAAANATLRPARPANSRSAS